MRHIVRDCQKFSKIEKDCLALEWSCIVLVLLEIHFSFDSHSVVVAFSRLKVSMRISVQRGLIGFHQFHNYFMNERMPYRVLEYMYDTRDASNGQQCCIVESLLQFSDLRR